MTTARLLPLRLTKPAGRLMGQLGDVVLFPRAAAGILVALAILLDDPLMLIPVVVGAVTAMLSSDAVNRLRGSSGGVFGYCGALVGAASHLTFTSSATTVSSTTTAVAVAAVGGFLCGPVAAAVTAVIQVKGLKRLELPVLTAPFCLISGAVTVVAGGAIKQPTAAIQAPAGSLMAPLDPAAAAGQAVLTNISQVLLVNNALSGALLLVGLLLIHWRLGVTVLASSAVAALVGWAAVVLGLVGTDGGTALQDGLLGYSAILTAVAVCVVFEPPARRTVVIAGGAAALTVPMAILLSVTPIPVFTWPYIVGTWMALTLLRAPQQHPQRSSSLDAETWARKQD